MAGFLFGVFVGVVAMLVFVAILFGQVYSRAASRPWGE